MVKFETRRDDEILVCETKTCKTSHWKKCNINETLRLLAKDVKILRSDEKFASTKILEVPFATSTDEKAHLNNVLAFDDKLDNRGSNISSIFLQNNLL